MNSLEILRCLCKIKSLVEKNNIKLTNNVTIKRQILDKLSKQEFNTEITTDVYNTIIGDILGLIDTSEILETDLIKSINICKKHDMGTNTKSFCIKALEDVLLSTGSELIKVGGIDDPGSGGDKNNPNYSIIHTLVGKDSIFTDPITNIVIENNVLGETDLLKPRFFNIPTDKELSPRIFNTTNSTGNLVNHDVSVPFTQQLLRFEELGRIDIKENETNFSNDFGNVSNLTVPRPKEDGFISVSDMGDFMENITSNKLGRPPLKKSNVVEKNPWKDSIATIINPPDFTGGVAEGRMPGINGEHKLWKNVGSKLNNPKYLSITPQCPARVNTGSRDKLQMHGYNSGEFGPGGLYHEPFNGKGSSTKNIRTCFHENLPDQKPESLWTFDGTFPPKLLVAKYGDAHILRHYNFLPIDPSKNRGFGLHTISTHEHNGPSGDESDGFAQSFFFPGEYYDYMYPMTLAGHTTTNLEENHPQAASPSDWERDTDGNIKLDNSGTKIYKPNIHIAGDWQETMSTHWFHDHMLDYTAHNVYKGNAAMMNYYSAIDRGNEEIEDGINLRLPSGTALSWGNRDYDVNLSIMDKAWDGEGQLWFNPFNTNGFLGDKMFVNWILEPWFEVRARRYRFRILNTSVSRFMKFALIHKKNDTSGELQGKPDTNVSYNRVPYWLIANDGNLMHHAVKLDGKNGTSIGTLPVIAIAERFDIIIDFSQFEEGDKLYLVNVLEHQHGKRPNREVPLHEICSEDYLKKVADGMGDPCVTKFMEFRIKKYTGTDLSIDPSIYEVGKRSLIPIKPLEKYEIQNAVQRNFDFVNKSGTLDEWAIATDDGKDYKMDPRRLSAAPGLNKTEIWTLNNGAPTWAHNVHIHFTEGKVLLRDNQLPPIWEQFARKDVYRIGGKIDSSESIVIALQFKDTPGKYMMHCHNTQHEDHAMLLRWDIEEPSCVKSLPCPLPGWNGVKYMETKTLPTFKTGLLQTNDSFVNPTKILNKLENIDKSVPDIFSGSYFVNGLGKSLQLNEDSLKL